MDAIPKDILNDLYIRFLQDVPAFKQIFSEIENMYWFYLDQFYVKGKHPNVDLIDFTTQVFAQFPRMVPAGRSWEQEFDEWRARKCKQPTSSALLLDDELSMVVLVKGFVGKRWTFPGGKKEPNEGFREAAIRETDEETGLDIAARIRDELCIHLNQEGVRRCHYIITDVDLETPFKPQTNHEIEKITWFSLDHLPVSRSDPCHPDLRYPAKDFSSTMYTIKIIKRWVYLVKNGVDRVAAIKQASEEHGDRIWKPNAKSSSRKSLSTTNERPGNLSGLSSASATQKDSPHLPVKHHAPVHNGTPTPKKSKSKKQSSSSMIIIEERSDRKYGGLPWPSLRLNVDEFCHEFSRSISQRL